MSESPLSQPKTGNKSVNQRTGLTKSLETGTHKWFATGKSEKSLNTNASILNTSNRSGSFRLQTDVRFTILGLEHSNLWIYKQHESCNVLILEILDLKSALFFFCIIVLGYSLCSCFGH